MEWEELASREEIYWRQKSWELWLKEGDKNTKFFHMSTQKKKEKNSIFSIQDSVTGNLLTKEADIQAEGFDFFTNFLSTPFSQPLQVGREREELLEAIPMIVSQMDNDMLLNPFTLDEIKVVVFSMPPDKALGLDGFTTCFFQKCWNFIAHDLLQALEESQTSGTMLKQFNVTHIALIPKTCTLKSIYEFTPISLCNLIYKIFTKTIYLRTISAYYS